MTSSALALHQPSAAFFARVVRSAKVIMHGPNYAVLDQDTSDFTTQVSSITNARECFPLHIRDQGQIGILYLYCSNDALDKDGQGVAISENFQVPASIARRYNFWRRVYSLWGKDQYVMHSSQYPEVIMEAYDISRADAAMGPVAREIAIKRVAKAQRDIYKNLLLAMHQLRGTPSKFSPAMQRLARSMAHIPDSDKYLVAAQTMRVQRGQRDFIASGLAVAPKYLPAIEEEFKSQGIPVEITRLAFVESSFNLKAHSKVGASGVYQIMPATGRQYLKMVPGVDERNDPIKASRAAAKLLRLNHNITGSWPLAITAYNHGVGGIRRATRAVGSNDLIHLINRYEGNAFGFASKNFYASFLGVLATLKDARQIFPEIPQVAALSFTTLRLPAATSVAALRKKYALTAADIAEYNPDINRSVVHGNGLLPRGYVVKLPKHAESRVVASAARSSR